MNTIARLLFLFLILAECAAAQLFPAGPLISLLVFSTLTESEAKGNLDPFFHALREHGYRSGESIESHAFVEKGGLMAYGVDYRASWRRAPFYADKILTGANPAFLPIEPPRFKLS